jgi:hypothetical protein
MIFYFSIIATILTIASVLDTWLSTPTKSSIIEAIKTNNLNNFNQSIILINKLFIKIFDRIYKYSNTSINRNIYRSVIFCYVFFFIMKFFIWAFSLKIPPTEYILITVIIISSYTVLIYKSFTGILPFIVKLREQTDRKSVFELLRNKKFLINFVLYSISFAIFTIIIITFTSYFGTNFKIVLVFSLWTVIVVFLSVFIVTIPTKFYKIGPLRSFLSSILFIIIITSGYLYFNNWDGNNLLISKNSSLLFFSYLAFNLFGDLISFQETRWILIISQKTKFKFLILLLILDILLSALCFLILPILSNTNINSVFQSLVFKGTNPWMGILFWTSFATSIIYYLYLISVSFTKLFFPIYIKMDKWFDIFKNPIRFIGFTSIIIFTFCFLIYNLIIK